MVKRKLFVTSLGKGHSRHANLPWHHGAHDVALSLIAVNLHPDNQGGMLYEKDLKADGTTEHKHFISARGEVIAVVKQTTSGTTVHYFHGDNLGSTAAITDEAGTVVERLAYEPFGKRRFPTGGADSGDTIAGILSLLAAIGDISRFSSPEKLVSYFGLNPSVYQSGLQPAKHGRISKRGRSQVRAMLVEAAWSAAKSAGPLRAFFLRIRDRRGEQIAAVATARKLAVIVWHVLVKDEPFAWQRPALMGRKRRQLQLQAGMPAEHGSRKGIGQHTT
jgi:hypothetical protein